MLRVAQQERRLVELERSGYDTTNPQAALAAFKQTLQQMIERRKEILLSLEKPIVGGCLMDELSPFA